MRFWRWQITTAPAVEDPKPDAPPEVEAPKAIELAVDQAKRFSDAADKIRQRAETSAKALAGLGTTALGAIGIAAFADIFPLEAQNIPWAVLLVVGFVATAVSIVWFSVRLWDVSRPVFTRSDLAKMEDLDVLERKTISEVYVEVARLNSAPSLRAYEARAWRLERMADRPAIDPGKRKRLQDQSALIRAEVRATQSRAAALVIRERSAKIVKGGWTLGVLRCSWRA